MADRILVVGELNVDLIVSGLPYFPMLGREVVASGLDLVLGSSSAICAAGLTRLGAGVDFVGKVGKDYYGDFVVAQLRQLGVGTTHVIQDPSEHTGVTISLTFSFDRALITHMGCIPILRLEDIQLSILRNYRHLHVGAYFLQRKLRPGLLDLFRQAHVAGLTVSLDTGCDPDGKWDSELLEVLRQVDIFFPNEDEARSIARAQDTETALGKLSARARLVVVKRGANGATSMSGGQIIQSPGFRVNVVDTTGAGDSFDAGFILARVVRGMPVEESLRFANACGALCVTGYGGTAAQPTLEQVQNFLKGRPA